MKCASAAAAVDEIDTPALVIERTRLEANLARMAAAAAAHGLALRPHAKTHKSVWIARRQRAHGARGHTVAKLGEAEALVAGGLDDIFVCYPIVGAQKVSRLLALARRARMIAAVDHEDAVETLAVAARDAGITLDVMIEVDTGLDRAGVELGAPLERMAAAVRGRPALRLRGICTHEGYAYSMPDPAERARVVRQRLAEFVAAGAALGVETISSGATPSVLQTIDLPGITEVRPGNYVFYDAMQVGLGAAAIEDCALSVLTTVVEVRASGRATVDAGSKALSSDAGVHGVKVVDGYGIVEGREDISVIGLSEEHGCLALDRRDAVSIGDRLRIIPNHACASMANFDSAYVVDGAQVVERIEVSARGAFC